MNFKKLVSLAAIVGQMTLVTGVAGAETMGTASTSPSPELVLLKTIAGLKDQGLSKAAYNEQMSEAANVYTQTATEAGRNERLEQALIDGHFMQPERAEQFVQNVSYSLQTSPTSENLSAVISRSVGSFQGDQLSNCKVDQGLGVLLVAGGVISIPFIYKYGTRDLSKFARNWTYAGAAAGIVTGTALLYMNRNCN